jgi:hypothetical protein
VPLAGISGCTARAGEILKKIRLDHDAIPDDAAAYNVEGETPQHDGVDDDIYLRASETRAEAARDAADRWHGELRELEDVIDEIRERIDQLLDPATLRARVERTLLLRARDWASRPGRFGLNHDDDVANTLSRALSAWLDARTAAHLEAALSGSSKEVWGAFSNVYPRYEALPELAKRILTVPARLNRSAPSGICGAYSVSSPIERAKRCCSGAFDCACPAGFASECRLFCVDSPPGVRLLFGKAFYACQGRVQRGGLDAGNANEKVLGLRWPMPYSKVCGGVTDLSRRKGAGLRFGKVGGNSLLAEKEWGKEG